VKNREKVIDIVPILGACPESFPAIFAVYGNYDLYVKVDINFLCATRIFSMFKYFQSSCKLWKLWSGCICKGQHQYSMRDQNFFDIHVIPQFLRATEIVFRIPIDNVNINILCATIISFDIQSNLQRHGTCGVHPCLKRSISKFYAQMTSKCLNTHYYIYASTHAHDKKNMSVYMHESFYVHKHMNIKIYLCIYV